MSGTGKVLIRRIVDFSNKHPMSKGMATYAVTWPLGSIIQQHIEGREKYDFGRTARYFVFGTFYVAPTLTLWLRFTKRMWPQKAFSAVLTKTVIENAFFNPFQMASFFFGMSLLEGNNIEKANQEVKEKLLPTFKVGVCVWPFVSMLNYTVIPERNRVPFISLCSLAWTVFLAYMKHLDSSDLKHAQPLALEQEKNLKL